MELTTLPGTLKFSREVVEVLLPYMRKGLTNSEALEHARFHKLLPDDCLPQPKDLLPPFPELPSQVINRPAGITRKIVNALIREHGKIDEIHLEIGSELGKTVDARRKLIKLQKNAFQLNAQAIEFLESNHLKFTSENLLVYRLWKSQNEKDILTNERITIQDISDGNAIELVINPRSFTRTFMNKLLILRKNLHNVNELMATIVDNYAINSELYPYIPDPKIENMQCRLNNGSTGEVAFIPRQAWLLKHILNHISANLKDVTVIAFPKPMVKFIKNTELFWLDEVTTQPSFKQKNINIIDAMILAKLDKSHIHALEKHLENPFDSHFRLNLNLSKETVCDFLSTFRPTLQPNRRLKGEAHLQTNFKVIDPKLRNLPSGERIVFPKDRMAIRNDPIKTFLLKRIPLQSISKANFDYIQNFETTPFLKEKLLKRLEKFDWNAEKAFQKPIEIPIYKKIKGARNEVKKVRMFTNKIYSVYIYEEARSVVAMKGGAVKYGDQVALNIYKYNSRYWGSPIYAMDILALRSKKARGEDTTFPKTFINGAGEYPLEPNAKFVCRLHYGDFVTFKTPDVLIDSNGGSTYKLISGYYGGYNRSTNTIQIINGLENEYFIQKGGMGIEELQKSTLLEPISTVAILKMETIVKKHVNILGDTRDCVSEEIPLV
jgi:hypothetical protein